MTERRGDPNAHLSTERLSALLEGELSSEETEAAHAHLARCRECRDEAARASELIRGYGRNRRWKIGLPIATAAAAALILVAVLPLDRSRPGDVTLRSTEAAVEREGVLPIPAEVPIPDARVDGSAVAFAWRPIAGEPTYVLTLTRADGDPIWSADTADTTAVLPDSISLEPGTTYLWYVDALLASGREATTGVRRFTVRP
jgi:hypothetical protein